MTNNFLLRNKYGFTNDEIKIYHLHFEEGSVEDHYISQAKYGELRRYLDYKGWGSVIHNKWISAKYFSAFNISIPKTYGLLHPLFGITNNNRPLKNAADLQKFISSSGISKFVLKHIIGGKGNAVYIIDKVTLKNDNLLYHTSDGQILDSQKISALANRELGGLKGYIFQENIPTHKTLTQYSSGAMSFLRVYTLKKSGGRSEAKIAYVNSNVKGLGSKSAYENAVYAAIDIETGVVQKEITFIGKGLHKESIIIDEQIYEGLKIPEWEEVKKLVCIAADNCPGLNWVGWDVVLSPEGPYLIEGNVGNTISILQAIFGGFKENGILDEWIEHLNIPDRKGKDRGELKNWKKRYLRKSLRKVIGR